jgi:hypothetical protein
MSGNDTLQGYYPSVATLGDAEVPVGEEEIAVGVLIAHQYHIFNGRDVFSICHSNHRSFRIFEMPSER